MKRPAEQPLSEEDRPIKRNNASFLCTRLLVTYPQNNTPKEALLRAYVDKYKSDIEWAVFCNEEHADGTMHSHGIVKFTKAKRMTHSTLDTLGGKHGNYKSAKGKNVDLIGYVIKDGNYVTHGFSDFDKEYKLMSQKKNPKENTIVDLVKEGATVETLLDTEHRGYVGFRMGRTKELIQEVQMISQKKKKAKYSFDDNISPEMNPQSDKIHRLLKRDVGERRRVHRQKHIWLYTGQGVGKTTLIEQLKRRCRVFDMPNKYPLEGYQDGVYDCMVFEEFKPGSCELSILNNITGGGSTSDGANRYQKAIKSDNLLVIIASNYQPGECYKNCIGNKAYMALLDRFYFLQFDEDMPIRIWQDPEDHFFAVFNDDIMDDYSIPSFVSTEAVKDTTTTSVGGHWKDDQFFYN